MSWAEADEPRCEATADLSPVELAVHPKPKDIGDFEVRRALPSRERRSVGPFVFFDEMGPADLGPGRGMDVRPHPHINLATITYLFEGAILHRDSLGTVKVIEPGAVNLMVAGRGIVHSERTPPELRPVHKRLHGLQLWMALPEAAEEVEPLFEHHPADTIPEWTASGVRARLIMGEANGRRSPVRAFSPILYIAYELADGAEVLLPTAAERALYVVEGEVEIAGDRYRPGCLAVLRSGAEVRLRVHTSDRARLALIGGEPLGTRHMFWNFVSSRRERIEEAKAAWREMRFPVVPGDEEERIPLPE